ncbi:MAG: D-alanyl-D-alanine carboxypeptidase family protein, partial [Firmicutes bacterium]|nr:D-alanyl-D-alanine carboxypeptidase family protein [Bacillota bacterium]
MATKKKKRRKKQKYLPAYIMLYAIIAIVIILIIVLIKSFAKGSAEETQTETSPPVSSAASAEPEATHGGSVLAPKPGANTGSGTAETTAAVVAANNTESDWALYVIGNNNPLPNDFTVETKSVSGERELDVRCADYAIQMLNDAKEQNVGLFVTSAYRSIEKQAANMESYINTLISQGYSQSEAKIQAEKEIALPGHSEH